MRTAPLLLFALLSFFSCNTSTTTETGAEDSTIQDGVAAVDTIANYDPGDTLAILPVLTDSGLVVQLRDVLGRQEVNTALPVPSRKIFARLPVLAGQKVSAYIEPAYSDCNLRISKWSAPNGSTDGPFGKSITYASEGEGVFTIEIGRDEMAEGRDSCRLLLVVTKE